MIAWGDILSRVLPGFKNGMIKTGDAGGFCILQVTRHKRCRWKGRIRTFCLPSADGWKYLFFLRIRLGFLQIRLTKASGRAGLVLSPVNSPSVTPLCR